MEPLEETFSRGSGLAALWASVLVGPICWALQMQISFMIVPLACAGTWPEFSLHLTTLIALILTTGAGALGWREWKRTGRQWPDQSGGPIPRSRFMAAGGVFLSAMFFLVILAQGIMSFLLGACQ